ncbi:monooxygenase [Planococcus rifietoensis]|uniref:Monooxygenase n=1 Tax=Planococcus rifietoensis TaxID=200991 RepID=A0A0U2YHF7_9BACL|nr:putative quinol monooxygenase [Planococcus rifietoensis]ALS74058.1 monooxygenase [Planococcus rifietoensis]
MMIIHAHLQVKPDQEQAFLNESKILIDASRQEPGNVQYDLMKSVEKDGHFTMVEVWKDAQAIEAHNASEHFTAFSKKAAGFMSAPMELKVYSGEAVRM